MDLGASGVQPIRISLFNVLAAHRPIRFSLLLARTTEVPPSADFYSSLLFSVTLPSLPLVFSTTPRLRAVTVFPSVAMATGSLRGLLFPAGKRRCDGRSLFGGQERRGPPGWRWGPAAPHSSGRSLTLPSRRCHGAGLTVVGAAGLDEEEEVFRQMAAAKTA